MLRRDLLRYLASVPILGPLLTSPAEAKVESFPTKPFVTAHCLHENSPLSPAEVMAGILSFNRIEHEKKERERGFEMVPDKEAGELIHDACVVMCKQLLSLNTRLAGSDFPDSAVYYPEHAKENPDFFKHVTFAVVQPALPTPAGRRRGVWRVTPEGTLYLMDKWEDEKLGSTQYRKVRSGQYFLAAQQAAEDILCPQIDWKKEWTERTGKEWALEIEMEIRRLHLNHRIRTNVYAIELPPYLGGVPPKIYRDFSICRRFQMKYARM